jgi:branched-chain amino acid transport system substrate-binding protein
MIKLSRRKALTLAAAGTLATPAIAQTKSMPGITAKEILLGQTEPYSGPASSYAPIAFSQLAYIDMVNEMGGINGRKIKVISLDDGYSPPRTVEQTRKLVEQENVAAIFLQLGTPCAMATRKYLNSKKVPQIFIASGATQFGDHVNFPWSIGWQPSYQIEGRIYAKYVLANKSDAKIAVLYQNDDSGKDYYKGFREGLGDQASRIATAVSYEVTDATIDSQIVQLRDSGANTLFASCVPKFQAMAVRKTYDLGWKPMYFMSNVGSSVTSGINPAGPEKAIGHLTAAYMKDPTDPNWAEDAGYRDWLAFMEKYQPKGDIADINNVYGYCAAMTLVPVLKQCGEDLSRENIMKQAANLDLQLPMFHQGIRFKTSATDYYGIKQLRMQRFDGKGWRPFGEPLGA